MPLWGSQKYHRRPNLALILCLLTHRLCCNTHTHTPEGQKVILWFSPSCLMCRAWHLLINISVAFSALSIAHTQTHTQTHTETHKHMHIQLEMHLMFQCTHTHFNAVYFRRRVFQLEHPKRATSVRTPPSPTSPPPPPPRSHHLRSTSSLIPLQIVTCPQLRPWLKIFCL